MATVVVATGFGGPTQLAVIDEPLPALGAGDVQIEVRAIGVNPIDAKIYSGDFGADPARLPIRPGTEAAGVVVAVGTSAVGPEGAIKPGDEVIIYPADASYASELVVPATSVVGKPAGLGWPEAGGLMTSGVTAVHLLTAAAVGAGDTVLVHGASGGVGLMVVQIAHARGARVIATASASKHEQLRALGAEPVAYGGGATALAQRVRALAGDSRIDAALDLAGTDEAIDASLELVADRDRIATILAFARGPGLGIKVLGGGPGADPGTEIRAAARIELVRLVADGKVQVFVSETFGLRDAGAAHQAIVEGRAARSGGKLILIP